MLLSFRFANHRSFRDEQQLNLTPLYEGNSANGSTAAPEAVRVVGVFGANASGKSNALNALAFMRRWATRSDRAVEPGLGVSREPYRLDRDSLSAPSRYVVDLLLNGVRYTYGFTLDDERVLEEWLYHYPLNRKRRVFEREGDEFKWGEESGRQGELERIAQITAQTALFLSTAARFRQTSQVNSERSLASPLHDVYLWFLRIRVRSRPGAHLPRAVEALGPDWENDRPVITGLLRAADVGIVGIEIRQPTIQELPFSSDRDLTAGNEIDNAARAKVRETIGSHPRILFTHRGAHGDVLLEMSDESAGTQQLLDLAIDAALVLRTGGTMTVDEIDASLHPMLSAKLIGLFQSPVTNPYSGQLIFTSHDAALLGTFDTEEVLHRDQIWFTEKADDGASVLYPLSDFKPRKAGENRPRRYLNGNYGGVPDLSSDLFAQALAGREENDAEAAH